MRELWAHACCTSFKNRVLFDCVVLAGAAHQTYSSDDDVAGADEELVSREIANLVGHTAESADSVSSQALYEVTEQLVEEVLETTEEQHFEVSSIPFPTSPLDMDEGEAEGWVNGESQPPRSSAVSLAYRDALDQPKASSARLRLILKTVTQRIKRTTKTRHGKGAGAREESAMDEEEVEEVEAITSLPTPARLSTRRTILSEASAFHSEGRASAPKELAPYPRGNLLKNVHKVGSVQYCCQIDTH